MKAFCHQWSIIFAIWFPLLLLTPSAFDCNTQLQSRTLPRFSICAHPTSDLISGWFARDGFWKDCLDLPAWAHVAHKLSRGTLNSTKVLDIGGNIGSCSLLMAAEGFNVTSFEPNPANYKLFKASLSLPQNANISKLVSLVPFAASFFEGNAVLNEEVGNRGNGVILGNSSEAKDFGKRIPVRSRIQLKKIDSLVHEHIHFMKLDCQGSEYQALVGAEELITRHGVDIMRIEFDGRLLRVTSSSPARFLRLLWKHGFAVVDLYEESKIVLESHHEINGTTGAVGTKRSERFVQESDTAAREVLCISTVILSQAFVETKEPFSGQSEDHPASCDWTSENIWMSEHCVNVCRASVKLIREQFEATFSRWKQKSFGHWP